MVGSEKYHNGKIEEQFQFVLNARLVMLFLLRRDICTKVRPEIRFEVCAE